MRILLYGFKPFGFYRENITEELIQRLPVRDWLLTRVFPVAFDEAQFLQTIEDLRPDGVIGMGQCRRGRKIRIERRAMNQRRELKTDPLVSINPGAEAWVAPTLSLKPDQHSRISYDAGRYVCNFSMYVLTRHCREHQLPYAFLHVPRGLELKLAINYVEKLLIYLNQLSGPARSGLAHVFGPSLP